MMSSFILICGQVYDMLRNLTQLESWSKFFTGKYFKRFCIAFLLASKVLVSCKIVCDLKIHVDVSVGDDEFL